MYVCPPYPTFSASSAAYCLFSFSVNVAKKSFISISIAVSYVFIHPFYKFFNHSPVQTLIKILFLSEGTVLVGPSHYQVGTIAESRIPGMSAEAYLHESIRDTDAYLVEGFTAGLMPNYDQDLSDQEVSDLVAYLLTLR
jgi:hypothetical protein